MKCETPFVRRSSPREPTPTKTLTLTDCAVGMGVVTTRMPLDSVETCHSMVIAGCLLPSLFCVQRPRLEDAAGRSGSTNSEKNVCRSNPGGAEARQLGERVT